MNDKELGKIVRALVQGQKKLEYRALSALLDNAATLNMLGGEMAEVGKMPQRTYEMRPPAVFIYKYNYGEYEKLNQDDVDRINKLSELFGYYSFFQLLRIRADAMVEVRFVITTGNGEDADSIELHVKSGMMEMFSYLKDFSGIRQFNNNQQITEEVVMKAVEELVQTISEATYQKVGLKFSEIFGFLIPLQLMVRERVVISHDEMNKYTEVK